MDTRIAGSAASGRIGAGALKTFALTGACGIPPTAVALSANVAVVAPSGSGDLVVFPAGTGAPSASTVSFSAGRTRANNVQLRLSSDGTGRATVKNNAAGGLDLVIDVNGYYQ